MNTGPLERFHIGQLVPSSLAVAEYFFNQIFVGLIKDDYFYPAVYKEKLNIQNGI